MKPSTLFAATLGLGLVFVVASASAQTEEQQAQALADVLSVQEAEDAYAAQNCGFYADVTSLCSNGLGCHGIGIPFYPATGPDFISERLGRNSPYLLEGYFHIWHPGRPAGTVPVECDPNSVVDYCYVAFPQDRGSGRVSYAGTADGSIFVATGGEEIGCAELGSSSAPPVRWPEIVDPVPGTTLAGSSVSFWWQENDVPVANFRLVIETAPGAGDIFDSGALDNATFVIVDGLPIDGSSVHARLEYTFADRTETREATFQAASIAPSSGTRLGPRPLGRATSPRPRRPR